MEKKIKKSQRARASKAFVDFTGIRAGGMVEYIMPKDMYNELLKECMSKKAGDIQKFLCDYVNEQLGILGTCVRVIPA